VPTRNDPVVEHGLDESDNSSSEASSPGDGDGISLDVAGQLCVAFLCEGEVLKLPILRLIMWLSSACLERQAISRGMGPKCSPE
jgi:hypothetical protein